MEYGSVAIAESAIPRTSNRLFQHLLDTYVSEANKVVATWREFQDADLEFKPHPRSNTVRELFKHQLLSERRFFAEFLGTTEVAAEEALPESLDVANAQSTFVAYVLGRLNFLASQSDDWWLTEVPFFDVRRERIWIFWRRVLHTAHHRTQLTVYLRLLGRRVPSVYGPTADVSWEGADSTQTVGAAGRRSV
jgi:uncharacterized damage-inducible protein DinB